MHIKCFLGVLLLISLANGLEECNETQITYSNTPCGPDGSHFIIKFPKNPAVCVVSTGPTYVEKCTQTCPSGKSLNLSSNSCEDCPVGTAAPGDVFEVNSWQNLPTGFYSDVLNNKDPSLCSDYGWFPQGTYLLGKSNSLCASELTLANKNIIAGNVTFYYKFDDPLSMAYFTIRNERCVLDNGKSHILPPSSKSNWAVYTAPVPAGVSTLQWYLFSENYYDKNAVMTTFKLKSVRVSGRPATFNCPECEPGYYADSVGAEKCQKCPQNTYSNRRASGCVPCPAGTFSLPGSSSCSAKQPCQPSEYFTAYTVCSAASNTQYWERKPIEPVICEDTYQSSATGMEEICQPCPLGTTVLNTTHCETCPTGFLTSAQDLGCHACPDDEVPIFGIKYDKWSRMPPRMTTYCLDDDVDCQKWKVNGSSIFVGPGLGNYVYSILQLELPSGFLGSKPNESNYLYRFANPLPGTKLVFDFEMDCQGECSLTFIVDSPLITLLISKWTGRVNRTTFSYVPYECEGATFIWEFKRWDAPGAEFDPRTRNDRAIIYSIEVNNTRDTGALGCKKCPLGKNNLFCKPCNDGLFYTIIKNETSGESHAECVPCPNGTMVIGDASAIMTVEQACKYCPPGTIPGSDETCHMDLQPRISTGQVYDFTTLFKGSFSTEGPKLFTSQGHEFQQHFNLFLNTRNTDLRSKCINDNQYDANITAWICRETWSPGKGDSRSRSPYRSRALSLGDKLVKGVPTNFSAQFAKDINERLVNGGWRADAEGTDYHLFFQTQSTISACPDGINTIVTLRCGGLSENGGNLNSSNPSARVEIPPNCAVGTCDGCQFHFMLISPLACPICRMEDYRRIEGGCRGGTMEVTLIPPKTCRPDAFFQSVVVEMCPILSTQGKIAVGFTGALVLLLLLTIFYCYRRNKKLEYKYMKLVEGAEARVKNSIGSSGSDTNQQGTECGIPEDEKETELYPTQHITAITGGGRDNKWNQLNPSISADSRGAGFGPVIFRTRAADDSHILTLDDGNEPI